MKFLKPVLAGAVLAAITLTANAVPAKRGVRTVTQPDGTELQVYITGDEFLHIVSNLKGDVLCLDNQGVYNYARIGADGCLESTGVNASLTPENIKTLSIDNIDMAALEVATGAARRRAFAYDSRPALRSRAAQTGIGLSKAGYPSTGSPKGLIILVEYSDVSFTLDDPKAFYEDMINGKNFTQYGGTGSALQYFTDQSNGVFTPEFDIYGPVKLPNKRSYYGGNDRYGDDENPHLMVRDAIKILDPTVDFSQFDIDRDGAVDNVYVFYAGQGEADYGPAESVWPHQWTLGYDGANLNLVVDGVRIEKYACSSEWQYKEPQGIGTFVHEFSHVMGLPDLYNTTRNATYTPGDYSVLDYGPYLNNSHTPPNYGAYERNALSWGSPIELTSAMTVTLEHVDKGSYAIIPTSKSTEFFLIENRQLEGWDTYIPNHGMLIWHIDYNSSVFRYNTVNNTQSHQYVDIVEANGTPNNMSDAAMKGYTWPGTTGKTSFTSSTTPALKSWAGQAINYPITGITEYEGLITFDVLGGTGRLSAPVASSPTPGANDRYFTAAWNAVPGATDYFLTVYASDEGGNVTLENGFDNSVLPDGWSADMTLGWYNTNTNFGVSKPSLKFANSGESITSPMTTADISEISYWMKGQSTKGSATSVITEVLVDGNWVKISENVAKNLIDETVVLTDVIPEGARQARFTMNKVDGNISFDDVTIKTGGKTTVLPDFNNVSTNGATSVRVDKLKEGKGLYTYTVVAATATQRSPKSEPVSVVVPSMSTGVEDITVDFENSVAPVEYFNLQGVRVANPTAGSIVIERRGNTVRKVVVR